MNKYLLSSICLLVSSCLFAANPLKIAKGEVPSFKKGDIAFLEIDMSDTTWEEKESMTKHFEDYDRLEGLIFEVFRSTYNENSKTIKISGDSDPDYRFVFHPKDFYCSVDGAFFKKNTRVWGTFTISEVDTGNEICVVHPHAMPSQAESGHTQNSSF